VKKLQRASVEKHGPRIISACHCLFSDFASQVLSTTPTPPPASSLLGLAEEICDLLQSVHATFPQEAKEEMDVRLSVFCFVSRFLFTQDSQDRSYVDWLVRCAQLDDPALLHFSLMAASTLLSLLSANLLPSSVSSSLCDTALLSSLQAHLWKELSGPHSSLCASSLLCLRALNNALFLDNLAEYLASAVLPTFAEPAVTLLSAGSSPSAPEPRPSAYEVNLLRFAELWRHWCSVLLISYSSIVALVFTTSVALPHAPISIRSIAAYGWSSRPCSIRIKLNTLPAVRGFVRSSRPHLRLSSIPSWNYCFHPLNRGPRRVSTCYRRTRVTFSWLISDSIHTPVRYA
jgi:hypothetical protein